MDEERRARGPRIGPLSREQIGSKRLLMLSNLAGVVTGTCHFEEIWDFT